jgi:hypothetical protein
MGRKKNASVVIVRKDKRLHKGLHLAALALTGGASGIVTAAKAGTNAGYNARTRKLMEQAEAGEQPDIRQQIRDLNEMSLAELRELITMPNGKVYSYWRDGSRLTAQQRVLLGMAKRRIARMEQPEDPEEQAEAERLAREYAELPGGHAGQPDLAAEQPGYDPDFDPAANFRRDHMPSSREYREAHGG